MLIDPEFVQEIEKVIPLAREGGRTRGRRSPRGEAIWRLGRKTEGRKLSRLERLFLRLLEADDLTIHVLLDASVSMTFSGYTPPQPSPKFDFARRLAASLGYAVLVRGLDYRVTAFSPARGSRMPRVHSRTDAPSLIAYLESLRAGGTRNFAWLIRKHVHRSTPNTVFVVVSDFRDRNWEWGAPALLLGEARIVLLHLMDRAELQAAEDEGGGEMATLEQGIRAKLTELATQYRLEYHTIPTDTNISQAILKAVSTR